jgi:hypothetical protein
MGLSESWVKRIFTRLGEKFGQSAPSPDDADAVRAWSIALDGQDSNAISVGLKSLQDTVPSAEQFRCLCLGIALKAQSAAPLTPAAPLAAAGAQTAASGWPMTPAQSVISRILDIAEGRNEMSRAQSDFLRVCIKMLRSNDPLRSRLLRHGIGEVDLQSS